MENFITKLKEKPREEKESLCKFSTLLLIEFGYTSVIGDQTKAGFANKEIDNDNSELTMIMKSFEDELNKIDPSTEHIDNFRDICDNFNINGISEKYYDAIIDIVFYNPTVRDLINNNRLLRSFIIGPTDNDKHSCGSTIYNGLI